jgi:hypothetical protein
MNSTKERSSKAGFFIEVWFGNFKVERKRSINQWVYLQYQRRWFIYQRKNCSFRNGGFQMVFRAILVTLGYIKYISMHTPASKALKN